MNILIANDDGWKAPGLVTLIRQVLPMGRITVIVPDGPRSGMSNAISAKQIITLNRLDNSQVQQVLGRADCTNLVVYTTNGTPSDCVKLAINVVFQQSKENIDLVLSGINHGSNAAINLIYSGTMGICFVAAEHAIPAIGFSIDDLSANPDFSFMESYIPQLITHLMDEGMPAGRCYNINMPRGPIAGIQWTRQCRSHWEKETEPTTTPDGQVGYTIRGYLVNDEPDATDTDLYALEHGMISIQPCTVDMTDYGAL